MFDPIERARETEEIVCKDDLRKYFRFRGARFYGGIATADCVGCNLSCIFCWSWPKVRRPGRYGNFNSPEDVARNLTNIARRKKFRQIRISGNEPTISRKHLIQVLSLVPRNLTFILETNGLLIGYDETFAEELSEFKNIQVRVSLKGTTAQEFAQLTGADKEAFDLQMKALENLYRAGAPAHPAVMASFSPVEHIKQLKKRLKAIALEFEDIEAEELVLYGDVMRRLKLANLSFRSSYDPRNIPPEQI